MAIGDGAIGFRPLFYAARTTLPACQICKTILPFLA